MSSSDLADSSLSCVSRRILAMFSDVGERDYIGEPVSIIAHSLQAAALSAELGDDEVTVAALLHDIGHVVGMEAGFPLGMNNCGIPEHERVGEEFLFQLEFSSRVLKLVRHHVTAKRYLCFKNPSYLDSLSAASLTTLSFQGGVMTEREAVDFEEDPDYEVIIMMRKWDEAAKIPGLTVPLLKSYFPLLDRFSALSSTLPSHQYIVSTQQRLFFEQYHYLKISNYMQYHQIIMECDSNLTSLRPRLLETASQLKSVAVFREVDSEESVAGGEYLNFAAVIAMSKFSVLIRGDTSDNNELHCDSGDVVMLSATHRRQAVADLQHDNMYGVNFMCSDIAVE